MISIAIFNLLTPASNSIFFFFSNPTIRKRCLEENFIFYTYLKFMGELFYLHMQLTPLPTICSIWQYEYLS